MTRQLSVLMLAMSAFDLDARVRRQASSLASAGHDVTVISYGPSELAASCGVRHVEVPRAPSPAVTARGRRVPGAVVDTARWLLLPEHRERTEARFRAAAAEVAHAQRADAVHAHDLVTLPLADRLAAASGARVVYDAHECWTGRPRVGRPSPIRRRRWRRLERELGARAAARITVSDGLADWFRVHHGWTDVEVIRNTFPTIERPPHAGPVRGLVYAGRIGPHRDLTTVAALSERTDLRVTLVGPADQVFAASFDRRRCDVQPPVAATEVDELYRDAGIALIPLEDISVNHRVALPNKLFHAVRAGVPVVAADLPELRRIVTRYRLGTLYRPGDAASLADAVERVRHDAERFRSAVLAAQGALSWEVDSARLRGLYARMASAHPDAR